MNTTLGSQDDIKSIEKTKESEKLKPFAAQKKKKVIAYKKQ